MTHWPLASLSSTLRGPGAATGGGGGTALTSITRASTEVPEYLHWKRSLDNRRWACSIYQSLTFTPSHRSLTQNDCPLWWNQTVRSLLRRRRSFDSHTPHIHCPPGNRNTAYDRLDANKAEHQMQVLTIILVPHVVTGNWYIAKEGVDSTGPQGGSFPPSRWTESRLSRGRVTSLDTTTTNWPSLIHWTVTGTKVQERVNSDNLCNMNRIRLRTLTCPPIVTLLSV